MKMYVYGVDGWCTRSNRREENNKRENTYINKHTDNKLNIFHC